MNPTKDNSKIRSIAAFFVISAFPFLMSAITNVGNMHKINPTTILKMKMYQTSEASSGSFLASVWSCRFYQSAGIGISLASWIWAYEKVAVATSLEFSSIRR